MPTTLAGLLCSTLFVFRPSALASGGLLVLMGVAMISRAPFPRPVGHRMRLFLCWWGLAVGAHLALLLD